MTHEEIGEAVKAASSQYDGFGGNCARFAAILNKVLGGEGVYLIVDGGHYEYADHVALLHEGQVYDGDGRSSVREFRKRWCAGGGKLEEFHDPSEEGSDVRRLAGEGFSAVYPDAALEEAFRARLTGAGPHPAR